MTTSSSTKDETIIDKYMKYLEQASITTKTNSLNDANIKPPIKIIESNKPIIRSSLLTIIFGLIISSCFLIKIYLHLNIEEFLNLLVDYYDFHDKRNYYILNSILLFKLYIIQK